MATMTCSLPRSSGFDSISCSAAILDTTRMNNSILSGIKVSHAMRISFLHWIFATVQTSLVANAFADFLFPGPIKLVWTCLECLGDFLCTEEKTAHTKLFMMKVPTSMSPSSSFTKPSHTRTSESLMCTCNSITSLRHNGFLFAILNSGMFQCWFWLRNNSSITDFEKISGLQPRQKGKLRDQDRTCDLDGTSNPASFCNEWSDVGFFFNEAICNVNYVVRWRPQAKAARIRDFRERANVGNLTRYLTDGHWLRSAPFRPPPPLYFRRFLPRWCESRLPDLQARFLCGIFCGLWLVALAC